MRLRSSDCQCNLAGSCLEFLGVLFRGGNLWMRGSVDSPASQHVLSPTTVIKALVKSGSFRETVESRQPSLTHHFLASPSLLWPNLCTWINTDTDTHTFPIRHQLSVHIKRSASSLQLQTHWKGLDILTEPV